MALENAKRLMELMTGDEAIQKKITEGVKTFTGEKTDQEAFFNAVLAPIAKEAGCECSYAEFAAYAEESGSGALSDEDVEAVAGGKIRTCIFPGLGVLYEIVD